MYEKCLVREVTKMCRIQLSREARAGQSIVLGGIGRERWIAAEF